MATFKGIVSFPTFFQPKPRQAGGDPVFSGQLLVPPNDPVWQQINAEFERVKLESFPSGLPARADVCWQLYDDKLRGKDYYDARFTGWWVLAFNAKANSGLPQNVVDMNYSRIIDPGAICSGMVIYVNVNMGGYDKGDGGIGCWVNGVMSTGELGAMGRLDNKPTVEQMFSGVSQTQNPATTATAHAAYAAAPGPGAPAAPATPTPPAAPAPAAPAKRMTAAAQYSYEQYVAAGWTDLQLIEQGMMERPVPTSFA